MYGCESWTIKKAKRQRIDAFELWCWRRLLRVPWITRRSNQLVLKEISPEYHWKDWCWSWISNTLATWCEEPTHCKRPWCWERLKAEGEGDYRGWDGWMASLTWWTWVWVYSGCWGWTGRPGMLRFMGSRRVGHDWATELNWRGSRVPEWAKYNKSVGIDVFSISQMRKLRFPGITQLVSERTRTWTKPPGCPWAHAHPATSTAKGERGHFLERPHARSHGSHSSSITPFTTALSSKKIPATVYRGAKWNPVITLPRSHNRASSVGPRMSKSIDSPSQGQSPPTPTSQPHWSQREHISSRVTGWIVSPHPQIHMFKS